jgi:hypothetical protein
LQPKRTPASKLAGHFASLSAIWSGVRLVSSCALFAENDSGLMPNWVTIKINGPNQFATPEELYPENPFHDF